MSHFVGDNALPRITSNIYAIRPYIEFKNIENEVL